MWTNFKCKEIKSQGIHKRREKQKILEEMTAGINKNSIKCKYVEMTIRFNNSNIGNIKQIVKKQQQQSRKSGI